MTPASPPTGPGDPDALRLVLFGLPGAGKSSLLGALGRASVAQEKLLGGKLDPGHGLEVLARQVAESGPGRPTGEVTTYPIRYIPVSEAGVAQPAAEVDAVLVDCDGRVAGDLLVSSDGLEGGPQGTLAYEIGEADGLILVLDAALPAGQVEGQFAEFARFLDAVQRARGAQAEVAGLPVFLVLNKCDKLAQAGDGPADWMERIEARKRELAERFRTFLADREAQPQATVPAVKGDESETVPEVSPLWTISPTFGRIDLYVWATAVRRPELAGVAHRSMEPFGVAELFRQALAEGREYRKRCRASGRRLLFVSIGSLVVVGALLAITLSLFALHRSTQLTLLESRVRDFQFLYQQGAHPGLAGNLDQLRRKKERLDEIRGNPVYPRLDDGLRAEIDGIHDNLDGYIAFLEQLLTRRPPTSEQVKDTLEESIEKLQKEQQKLPEQWKDTPAASLIAQRIAAGQALARAVQRAYNWYLDSAEQAERLLQFSSYPISPDGTGIEWPEWTSQVEKLLSPQSRPPFRLNDPIPEMEGAVVTFAAAMRFDTVENARRRWLDDRDRLRRLLAICAAVGLAAPRDFKAPAVLDIPATFRLGDAQRRLAQLKVVYPDYEKRFSIDAIPDRARSAVRRAAQAQYGRLVKVGQAEVLAQLRQAGKGSEETAARWEAVRAWLKSPQELSAWRELAKTLLRLQYAVVIDPVTELDTFLGTKQFTVEVDSIALEVSLLNDLKPRADARLLVQHAASGRQPALTFESSGTPVRDDVRRVVVYTFRRSGPRRLLYKPGEALSGELQLSGGKERLVWSYGRSKIYQIDRLRQPPRRQSVSAKSPDEGRIVTDVRLGFVPEDGYPAIPDLLPWVNLED